MFDRYEALPVLLSAAGECTPYIMVNTGYLRPEGGPFSGFRYMKG